MKETYQVQNRYIPTEDSPDVVLTLLKNGVINREEAGKMQGLFDEKQLLCH